MKPFAKGTLFSQSLGLSQVDSTGSKLTQAFRKKVAPHKSSIKLVLSKITDLGIGHTLLPLNPNYFNEHASL